MKKLRTMTIAVALCAAQAASAQIALETAGWRWEITSTGRNAAFLDKASGADYADPDAAPCFALVKVGGQTRDVSGAVLEGDRLTLSFADTAVRAVLRIHTADRYLAFEVVSVEGGDIDELTFLNASLTLEGRLDEPFAACLLALNLQTNVLEIPGPNRRLRAMCYPRFGLEGAKAALVACPPAQMREIMKEVIHSAPDLPQSDIGGPYALDAPGNRGSYLFDFGQVTETTVDRWIPFVKDLGLNQIDFHTGGSLRFGDCAPNLDLFPNGRASVKAVIDKLHAAGIAAGLHTYAFFIAKNTPYVTPVPDPRLGCDAEFTLAEDLSGDGDRVTVLESTEHMSADTGFFIHNSATLRIDDELVTYKSVSQSPHAFSECTRGACGTKALQHAKGAKILHLKECFGLFAPDADSTLLDEVAANTADTFNECGFDMIYLDALDGEGILAGGENGWHYGSKFAFAIAKRLKKPALFEMSTFHHHLWYIRARMGAWDHPSRSHKRFIDVHCAANKQGDTWFLPMSLGWWAVKTWQDGVGSTSVEPTYPDDIEYLMCKALATNSGIALMGVNPDNIDDIPAYQRLTPIFRRYEELRHSGRISDTVRAVLATPGAEFALEDGENGEARFRPASYVKQKICGNDDPSAKWTIRNPYARQPLRVRIEALMGAASYDDPAAVVIEDFSNPAALTDRACADQVAASLDATTDTVKTGDRSGRFASTSRRSEPNGAWAKIGRQCAPALNIEGKPAFGLWVHGDGKGELLNLQLMSSAAHAAGGIGDHYIDVDFTGWRYFALVELEGGRIQDYQWPYGGSAYGVYREDVNYSDIRSVALWYNRLPRNTEAACLLSPIKALPLAKIKVANPHIAVGGSVIVFPVEFESGTYLEFGPGAPAKVYGPKGEPLAEIAPQGEPPVFEAGDNAVEFGCDSSAETVPRVRVTAILQGEPI